MIIALYLKFQRRIRAGDKMRLGQATANLEFCVSKMYEALQDTLDFLCKQDIISVLRVFAKKDPFKHFWNMSHQEKRPGRCREQHHTRDDSYQSSYSPTDVFVSHRIPGNFSTNG